MPDLEAIFSLLQRHHRTNRSTMHRGIPTSAEWHSLWGKLAAIRQAATDGDLEASAWLALNGPMITAVEACRAHDLRDAVTYRGPSR